MKKEKLLQARPDFIDQVSNPVLNKLLDELLERGVLTDAEREAARAKPRAEKAGHVIDMVRNKGAEASSHMITILSTNDPFLSEELNLKERSVDLLKPSVKCVERLVAS
uniref:CARD domain-containing protein n=1 Tax=Lates calcarifer TaxID=8187 RepID=A0A4W6BQU4_LATCA